MRTVILSLVLLSAMLSFKEGQAADAKIDLSVQNAAVEKLNARIAARAAKILEWKNGGAIGEELTGLVTPRTVAGQSLAVKKEIRDLVVAENEDRYALLREWVLANGLQEKDLDAIGNAFAATRRKAAMPGHWVQDPASKQWVQKKDLP